MQNGQKIIAKQAQIIKLSSKTIHLQQLKSINEYL